MLAFNCAGNPDPDDIELSLFSVDPYSKEGSYIELDSTKILYFPGCTNLYKFGDSVGYSGNVDTYTVPIDIGEMLPGDNLLYLSGVDDNDLQGISLLENGKGLEVVFLKLSSDIEPILIKNLTGNSNDLYVYTDEDKYNFVFDSGFYREEAVNIPGIVNTLLEKGFLKSGFDLWSPRGITHLEHISL